MMNSAKQLHDVDTAVQELLAEVKLLLLDVDGVLSDGKIVFTANGDEAKAFSTLDGQGIKMLQRSGVLVGVITGRKSALTERRCRDLGINLLKQGREDKWTAFEELRNENASIQNIQLSNIAYMGDDYPDLLVMSRIGLPCTPCNAVHALTQRAKVVTNRAGGEGAVREICDLIMQSQGSYDAALQRYLPQS